MFSPAAGARHQVPRFLLLATAIVAMGGLLYGYNLSVVAGTILFIREAFGLSAVADELFVATALVGAMLGAAAGGLLVERWGRRTTLMVSGLVPVAGALLTALAASAAGLFAGRLAVGAAFGLASFAGPLYLSEIAPCERRGRLVSVFTLGLMVGVLLSDLVDYLLAAGGHWRWMLALGALPGVLLCLGVGFLPETPHWLMCCGREDAAHRALARVRGGIPVDRELETICAGLGDRRAATLRELFGPLLRPALVLGIGLAVIRQATGIVIGTFYAPTIFVAAGFATTSAGILAAVAAGATLVLTTLVALALVDRLGRRPLLLAGLAGMAVCLGMLGLVFDLAQSTDVVLFDVLALTSLILFVAMWTIGPGTVSQLVIAEIFPARVRGLATGVATAFMWGAYALAASTFLSLTQLLGDAGTFWFFALTAVFSAAFAWRYQPETRGRSLEEIAAHWQRAAAAPPDAATDFSRGRTS